MDPLTTICCTWVLISFSPNDLPCWSVSVQWHILVWEDPHVHASEQTTVYNSSFQKITALALYASTSLDTHFVSAFHKNYLLLLILQFWSGFCVCYSKVLYSGHGGQMHCPRGSFVRFAGGSRLSPGGWSMVRSMHGCASPCLFYNSIWNWSVSI